MISHHWHNRVPNCLEVNVLGIKRVSDYTILGFSHWSWITYLWVKRVQADF